MDERGFSRKDFLKGLVAATATGTVATTVTGCKSLPTAEVMYSNSLAIGYATGMIANQCKIRTEDRQIVIDIVNIVSQTVPAEEQTFEEAWTPIAKAHVQKLIDEGKIDKGLGDIILAAFAVVVKGIDYIFEVRFPKAKLYKDLVIAAIDGFTTGFLTVFKPENPEEINGECDACCERALRWYDREAYDYLKANR